MAWSSFPPRGEQGGIEGTEIAKDACDSTTTTTIVVVVSLLERAGGLPVNLI